MAVIINEFELVSEPAPPPARREEGGERAVSAPQLRPADIERIVRHFEARRERLRAD